MLTSTYAVFYVCVGYPTHSPNVGISSVIHSLSAVQFMRKMIQPVDFSCIYTCAFCLYIFIFPFYFIHCNQWGTYVHRFFQAGISIPCLVFPLGSLGHSEPKIKCTV